MEWNDYKAIAQDILDEFIKWIERSDVEIKAKIFNEKQDLNIEMIKGIFLANIHNGMEI